MEAVLKIDESYQGYSVYLGLGRLYLQAPHVLGGDTAKAIEYLEKGVKLAPDNMLMRYELAEAYEKNNRDAEAKKNNWRRCWRRRSIRSTWRSTTTLLPRGRN
jgi:tetratricopeptide (TPR) repeat protein